MTHAITSDMIIILLGLVTWLSFRVGKSDDKSQS
jgi:hypothetical protein